MDKSIKFELRILIKEQLDCFSEFVCGFHRPLASVLSPTQGYDYTNRGSLMDPYEICRQVSDKNMAKLNIYKRMKTNSFPGHSDLFAVLT
jgi:hypothetical protein